MAQGKELELIYLSVYLSIETPHVALNYGAALDAARGPTPGCVWDRARAARALSKRTSGSAACDRVAWCILKFSPAVSLTGKLKPVHTMGVVSEPRVAPGLLNSAHVSF